MAETAIKTLAILAMFAVGIMSIIDPHTPRDQQVRWWQSNSGLWAFRIAGLFMVVLALYGAWQTFKP